MKIPVFIHHQILRLDVAMDDTIHMKELQSSEDSADEESNLVFIEAPATCHMVPQITAWHEV
jgi:hypothetical protein